MKSKDSVIYLTAEEEDTHNIAQANVKISGGELAPDKIKAGVSESLSAWSRDQTILFYNTLLKLKQ